MPQSLTDRNLLFGILALQMDFISRDDLITAMHAWVLEKTKPLGHILRDMDRLAADELALLEALVQKHLARHGNVWQWCQDRYFPYSQAGRIYDDKEDINNVITSNQDRVLRGCAFNAHVLNVRSAQRNSIRPADRVMTVGLRVARTYR
jgi:hypothetical protein